MVLQGLSGIELLGEISNAAHSQGATVRVRFTSMLQLESAHAARVANVLVLDGETLDVDGVQLVHRLTSTGNCSKIIVLVDAQGEGQQVIEYLRAGARGLVFRDGPAEELVDAIRTVARGHVFISPPIASYIIDSLLRHLPSGAYASAVCLEQLTRREQEIFDLLTTGMSNAEIAAALSVSEKTVKFHVSNILSKLHLRSRVQAVVYAASRKEDRRA